MNQPFSIVPPPELVLEWYLSAKAHPPDQWVTDVATKAAQYGADQELEACCLWLNGGSKIDYDTAALLRAARRPKPPSLKAQAQSELDRLIALIPSEGALAMAELIRRALEALDD